MIFPGVPHLRLSPESLAAVGEDAAALPMRASRERHVLPVAGEGATTGLPLRRLYVLESGDGILSHLLRPAHALMHLVRHSYGAGAPSLSEMPAHFQRCSALASRQSVLSVHRLQRPRKLASLAQVAALVEREHWEALADAEL